MYLPFRDKLMNYLLINFLVALVFIYGEIFKKAYSDCVSDCVVNNLTTWKRNHFRSMYLNKNNR